ncbi:MAG: PorP/SprF family type IX secretion system membrane protein [Bacteroidia bacterium]|nr:PorP/SprF family type IX secretion system membrane protein [Bacteroidia bacterium]
MKKYFCFHIFLLVFLFGQQTQQYTQFLFNKAGYNPAASGYSFRSPYEIIFGGRNQWIGFGNEPSEIFLNANYTLIPPRAYKSWHNFGVYVQQDINGAFINNGFYLGYAYHKFLLNKTVMAVGVFGGAKQFFFKRRDFDKSDPAVSASNDMLWAYPEIIPGIRIYNKKFFWDLSLWQTTVFRMKGLFGSKKIGAPSKTPLHYITTLGLRFNLPYYNHLVCALNLRGTFRPLPNPEISIMNYFYQRFAYGINIRNRDFICGIIQFRIVNHLVVGLAYDLAINKMIKRAPHTAEIMIGLSPIFGNDIKEKPVYILDDCYY